MSGPKDPCLALTGTIRMEDFFRAPQHPQVLDTLPQGHDLIRWRSGTLQGGATLWLMSFLLMFADTLPAGAFVLTVTGLGIRASLK